MDTSKIEDHMPVVGSDSAEVGTVDHLDVGDMIKLTRDADGNHHWIPQVWVARIDRQVHLDRPAGQAREQWSTSAPKTDQ